MTTIDTPATLPATPKPKRKKRIFMWFFIAVQAVFLAWVIGGSIAGHSAAANAVDHATAIANACGNGGWKYLYASHAQCVKQYGQTLTDAGDAGTAIGAALVVMLWVATDVILGIGRLVVVFARKRSV